MAPCSVCKKVPVLQHPNTKLGCEHEFCDACYTSYINGSLLELNHAVRCSICGTITVLTVETKNEQLVGRFGRDQQPSLQEPRGLFLTSSGHYIIVDSHRKRVIVFDDAGNCVVDFAYVYGCEPQNGVIFTHDGHIVLPLRDPRYTSLAYYNLEGEYRGSLFLRHKAKVGGMSLAENDTILVTDGNNRCVYTISRQRIITNIMNIEQLPEEYLPPKPCGITTRPNGDVILTDRANHRVRVYDKDWKIKDLFGKLGQRPGEFNNPIAVKVTEDDNIVVVDNANNRVQMFTSSGRFIRFLVRYNEISESAMAPVAIEAIGKNIVVMLSGTRVSKAGEIRLYST